MVLVYREEREGDVGWGWGKGRLVCTVCSAEEEVHSTGVEQLSDML